MAARDRYTRIFKCEACGTTGEARLSEADHPWGGPDLQVDHLPPDFVYSKPSEFPQRAEFSCSKCGEQVW
jgi:predicted RNA-binding Zn-ribbon protein involved in translation (DUF1610 family)